MIISEVITELERLKDEFGDLPVYAPFYTAPSYNEIDLIYFESFIGESNRVIIEADE